MRATRRRGRGMRGLGRGVRRPCSVGLVGGEEDANVGCRRWGLKY